MIDFIEICARKAHEVLSPVDKNLLHHDEIFLAKTKYTYLLLLCVTFWLRDNNYYDLEKIRAILRQADKFYIDPLPLSFSLFAHEIYSDLNYKDGSCHYNDETMRTDGYLIGENIFPKDYIFTNGERNNGNFRAFICSSLFFEIENLFWWVKQLIETEQNIKV